MSAGRRVASVLQGKMGLGVGATLSFGTSLVDRSHRQRTLAVRPAGVHQLPMSAVQRSVYVDEAGAPFPPHQFHLIDAALGCR
jgi:hypothetical protein